MANCPCGRLIATFPTLAQFQDDFEEATKQLRAFRKGKCLGCYKIDLEIEQALKIPQNSLGEREPNKDKNISELENLEDPRD